MEQKEHYLDDISHQLHPLLQILHSLSAKAVGPTHSFPISMKLNFERINLGLFFC